MPTSFVVHDQPLPYVAQLQSRETTSIDLVVIHCTELPDLAMAREFGERALYDAGTGNSGHYYVDRDGSVYRYVEANRIAHHTRGYNERSIGIELVNRGRWPDWLAANHQRMQENYSEAQIDALLRLLGQLRNEYPRLRWIAGHEDLDRGEVEATDNPVLMVRRKRDPGEHFPWSRMSVSGLERLR
ncbi:MAG: N-acetylmuramoyl-L-alanine amidase [Tahibacter sp.]